MNETDMFAALGRKQATLDSLNDNYDQLLFLLAQVAGGAIDPARVSVDLQTRTWAVAPPAGPVTPEKPAETVQ